MFRSLEIPFLSEKEQRRIAAILDKAEAIRHKRQKAMSLTHVLARNAFLELFGDPVTNLHGFESRKVEALLSNARGAQSGPFKAPSRSTNMLLRAFQCGGLKTSKKTLLYQSRSFSLQNKSFKILSDIQSKMGMY